MLNVLGPFKLFLSPLDRVFVPVPDFDLYSPRKDGFQSKWRKTLPYCPRAFETKPKTNGAIQSSEMPSTMNYINY